MTSSAPLVSVVIPTFNRADLIKATIASVLAQTMADLEVIVVDDGSTDDTQLVVEGIADPRVCYTKNTWSGLPAVGRNTGIRLARGAYVAFVDSDDLWYPEKLEVQLKALERAPDAGMCICDFHLMDHDTGAKTDREPISAPAGREAFARHLLRGNFIGSLAPLVRREVFDDVGQLNEDQGLRFCEDWEIWLRIAARYKVIALDDKLAAYRVHGTNSASHRDLFTNALRYASAISAAVSFDPTLYGGHADVAVSRYCVSAIRQLLVQKERDKAAALLALCTAAAPEHPELKSLDRALNLPSPVLSMVLAIRRIMKQFLG